MIKKKVCLLGAFSVGKTSLVKRFIQSIFSEKYQTTIGVKIDKKTLIVDGRDVTLMLWDLPGEDGFQSIRLSYLQKASGFLLVIDGTRKSTLDTGFGIREKVRQFVGDIPFVLVINKVDLVAEWEFDNAIMDDLAEKGITAYKTSAKTGDLVEEAFNKLAEKMLISD